MIESTRHCAAVQVVRGAKVLHVRRLGSPAAHDEEGFLLIEVVVAMVVFAMLAAAVAAILVDSFNSNRSNKSRTAATGIAARILASTRGHALDDKNTVVVANLPDGTTTCDATHPSLCVLQDGTSYTVQQTIATTTTNNPGSTCISASTDLPAYKLIGEEVTWPNMDGVAPVRTETLVALPQGSVDATKGAIAVAITTNSGAAVSGATVTLSGPATGTATSDANGCAFFTTLAAGTTYQVSATLLSYVTALDAPTVVNSGIVVVAGQTTKTVLSPYEKGGTLTVATSAASLPGTVPATIQRTGKTQLATGTTYPKTSPLLFTSGGQFSVWAGSCADSKPAAPATVGLSPGGTATVSVPARLISVLPTKSGTVTPLNNGAPIYAVHAPDGSCTSGESYQIGTATTAAISVSLPLGTWLISTNSAATQTDPYPGSDTVVITATAPTGTTNRKVAP